jgi:integral membrane protein (TIGR01906 family)
VAASAARPVYHAAVSAHLGGESVEARSVPERLAAIATAIAVSIVVIAIAILPFLTPAWISFEQGRTNAAALAGFSEADLAIATNAILHDLVLGPPEFAVEVGGTPVLEERERSHMRDVRGVFGGFYLLAAIAAVGLVVLVAGARRMGHPERAWSAISTGMRGLIVGIVVAGVVAAVAFDQLFSIFHQLFFPAGSFTFDPRTDRLVQLFPFEFWSETTIVLGVVIVVAAAILSVAARRLARRAERRQGEVAPADPLAPVGVGAAR